MHIFKDNRNLLIIALIAIVNALGYGIIIPILYSYSERFGLNAFQNGMLFAVYSICQFISTPLIGRLSDKYGRRPTLIISILGTAGSFFLMASAPNALFLFLARALDGMTAGNIPVALAVISDTTSTENRAKGFGVIGASFSFGFVFGPAISAMTVGISPALPFLISGVISLFAALMTIFFLPETNTHMGEVKSGKLFDLPRLYHALREPHTGRTFVISLLYAIVFAAYVTTFQPYAKDSLHMTDSQISLLFTCIGIVGLVSQVFLIPLSTKYLGLKNAFTTALAAVAIIFLGMVAMKALIPFVVISLLFGLINAAVYPLLQTILSQDTDAKSQGTMQGLNSSYMSVGQIIGPLIGGSLATISIMYPFLLEAGITGLCVLLSLSLLMPGPKKESAFE